RFPVHRMRIHKNVGVATVLTAVVQEAHAVQAECPALCLHPFRLFLDKTVPRVWLVALRASPLHVFRSFLGRLVAPRLLSKSDEALSRPGCCRMRANGSSRASVLVEERVQTASRIGLKKSDSTTAGGTNQTWPMSWTG